MTDGGCELGGGWVAREAEGDLHQRFVEPGFDDAGWDPVTVPGHWRSTAAFADSDGPVLYRRRFPATPLPEGRRRFLTFDGVFYYGDVWLDGGYLGATEGYFAPHIFEITDVARSGMNEPQGSGGVPREHCLAVEVACPKEGDRHAKRMVTGVFSHWDGLDPDWNPGGLWRPVRLSDTGPVRLSGLRCLCVEATEDRGRLLLSLTVDAPAGPVAVHLRARLTGPGRPLDFEQDQTLATGENHLSWTLEVDRPARWWPWRYGPQPLYDLEVAVEMGGLRSDGRLLRTAFREVRNDGWRFHVNGERLFVMGSNQGPAAMALGAAEPAALAADVTRAVDANLDMLRIHGHVTRPEIYAAADEAGLLLWQDVPLQWAYGRGARRPAAAQARALVDLLGHHPSVVVWCGHNEPYPGPADAAEKPAPWRTRASILLPSWNKDVLDRSVSRALRSDPTRPVIVHSGVPPGPLRDGTDSHLYFGWYLGGMADMAGVLRRWPRLARFVSEFGAQAVPEAAAFMEPERWPDLDWERLAARHNLQRQHFERFVPPDEFATFEDWRAGTQAYQAALIQLQAEDLRRLRYRPTGGFLQFCFADGHPGVTWSVLDHERLPKAGHAALAAACRSVLPMVDPRTGHVHVANERRTPFPGAEIEVSVGDDTWGFGGDLAADSLAYVGRVDVSDGTRSIVATLRHDDLGKVVNSYGAVLLDAVLPDTGLLGTGRLNAGRPAAGS
ncbi:MAG: beta-mannosidase [Actinomycetota bacterium]|nr:beta-mannosidase [Actinomycetota bacterium]